MYLNGLKAVIWHIPSDDLAESLFQDHFTCRQQIEQIKCVKRKLQKGKKVTASAGSVSHAVFGTSCISEMEIDSWITAIC